MTSEQPQASRSEQLEAARSIALSQLESRARTEAELRQALARRDTPADVAEEVIARFKDVGLIDDQSFARDLTTTRLVVQRRGAIRIRQELRSKGVPDEIAQEAVAGIDAGDELEAAKAFAIKKMRSYQRLEPLLAKRRLYGALARRGFSADVVRQATEWAMTDQPDSH